ncbi:MAG: Hsp20/alpha crystallin family protein [Bacteroidota bacterium]
MNDKDRKEEKLDEIRRRVRLAEEREKRGEPDPDSERGPAVSTWHSAEQDRPREEQERPREERERSREEQERPREEQERPREPRDAGRYPYGSGIAGYPGAPTYPMYLGYAPMIGGYPGYTGYPTPVGMPFEGPHANAEPPGRYGHEGSRSRAERDREREDRERRERGPAWTPRAEAFERSGHRIFRLELPGVDKHDAEVRIEGNRLIVEGERRRDEENDREEFRSEWPYGRFYRAFSLPYPVDPSDVKARYRNGVLDIAVPQPTREERRRAIKVEG